MNKEINCYLCPEKATIDGRGFIHCDTCTWYTITSQSDRYFFNRPDKKVMLDDEDKAKLSAYVQEHYSDEEGKPVQITTDLIEKITGKKSINIRYV